MVKQIYLTFAGLGDSNIQAFETAIGAIVHILDKGIQSDQRLWAIHPEWTTHGKEEKVPCDTISYERVMMMKRWLEKHGYLRFNWTNFRILRIPYIDTHTEHNPTIFDT